MGTTPPVTSYTSTTTMSFKIAVILAVATIVSCKPNPPPSYSAPSYDEPAPSYKFDYGVKDDYHGVNFGHTENRDGYQTQGVYYVALPDGRLQTVNYHVNEHGEYFADVTYEGEAHYPEEKPAPYKPAPYKAAPPAYKPAPAAY